jgi:hypothetical protein
VGEVTQGTPEYTQAPRIPEEDDDIGEGKEI